LLDQITLIDGLESLQNGTVCSKQSSNLRRFCKVKDEETNLANNSTLDVQSFQKVRGMYDIFPEEQNKFNFINQVSRKTASLYGYKEVLKN
jgi:hypothetical protein